MSTDKTTNQLIVETAQRTRRIETRLTKFLEEQGLDLETRKPYWNGRAIILPNPACALAEIMAAIPEKLPIDQEIPVYYHQKFVVSLYRDEAAE